MEEHKMENTRKILSTIQNELNANPMAQAVVSEMAKNAERMGYTPEQWEQAKIGFMASLFYKLVEDHEDIKEQVALDLYNELRQ